MITWRTFYDAAPAGEGSRTNWYRSCITALNLLHPNVTELSQLSEDDIEPIVAKAHEIYEEMS